MSAYDSDILEWSERQAALLRRAAAGERVNDLDWPNIIEEIESVGGEQLHAVESLLVQALLHDLKAEAWPLSRDVEQWRAEARGFRDDAAGRFAPVHAGTSGRGSAVRPCAATHAADDRRPAAIAAAGSVSAWSHWTNC